MFLIKENQEQWNYEMDDRVHLIGYFKFLFFVFKIDNTHPK